MPYVLLHGTKDLRVATQLVDRVCQPLESTVKSATLRFSSIAPRMDQLMPFMVRTVHHVSEIG